MNRLYSIKSIDWGILENVLRSHYGVTSFGISDDGDGVKLRIRGCGSRFVGIAMVGVYGDIIGEGDIEVIEDIDDGIGVSCIVRVCV